MAIYYLTVRPGGAREYIFARIDQLNRTQVNAIRQILDTRERENRPRGVAPPDIKVICADKMSIIRRAEWSQRWNEDRAAVASAYRFGRIHQQPPDFGIRERLMQRAIELEQEIVAEVAAVKSASARALLSHRTDSHLPEAFSQPARGNEQQEPRADAELMPPAFPGKWYEEQTDEILTGELLRTAAHENRIVARKGNGRINHYTLASVVTAWPQWAAKLNAAAEGRELA